MREGRKNEWVAWRALWALPTLGWARCCERELAKGQAGCSRGGWWRHVCRQAARCMGCWQAWKEAAKKQTLVAAAQKAPAMALLMPAEISCTFLFSCTTGQGRAAQAAQHTAPACASHSQATLNRNNVAAAPPAQLGRANDTPAAVLFPRFMPASCQLPPSWPPSVAPASPSPGRTSAWRRRTPARWRSRRGRRTGASRRPTPASTAQVLEQRVAVQAQRGHCRQYMCKKVCAEHRAAPHLPHRGARGGARHSRDCAGYFAPWSQ